MHDEIPDLWPQDIETTGVPTPLAILKIQANNLRTKTKGLIEAEIRCSTDHDKEREIYHFDLIAPALDGYTVRLFSADHAASLVYPIDVNWHGFEHGYQSAATPQEIYAILRDIFGSRGTKSLLMSLVARSNERQAGSTNRMGNA